MALLYTARLRLRVVPLQPMLDPRAALEHVGADVEQDRLHRHGGGPPVKSVGKGVVVMRSISGASVLFRAR